MSAYKVYVTPSALREIKSLPGNIRQRVKAAITGFAADPRPAGGKKLELSDIDVWRLRLDKWRIMIVDVLGLRKRPPYDYGDLESLINEI